MKREPLLVSACLLGYACRYDGKSVPASLPDGLFDRYRPIPVCPELAGGLSLPRPPAEIDPEGEVKTETGLSVSREYREGAERTLALARSLGCRKALLKEKSPSCGVHRIHDGAFSGRTVPGRGVTATLLAENGIAVFSEEEAGKL